MDFETSTPSPEALAKRYQELFWNLPPSQPRRPHFLARLFKLPRFIRLTPKPRFV